MSLEIMLKRLGLSTIQRVLPELTLMAEKEAWPYSQFLERLVSEEMNAELPIRSQEPSFRFMPPSRPLISPSKRISNFKCWDGF